MIYRNRYSLLLVACSAVAGFLIARAARAADLPTIQPSAGFDWTGPIIVALIALAVAGAIIAHRRWPSEASKVDRQLKADGIAVLGEIRDKLHTLADRQNGPGQPVASAEVSTPQPAAPTPAGGLGRAGPVTIQATGEPQADLAAFQAAYFKPEA